MQVLRKKESKKWPAVLWNPDFLAGSFLKSLVLAILGMSAALNKTWRQFILWVEKWALWYAGTNLYIQIVVVVVEGGGGG
jgi:hypothetical protein